MLKAGLVSLGCAKNRVDAEVMLGLLKAYPMEITPDPADADIIVVNTCGFIDSAKQESIQTILQMAAYKKAGQCRGLIMTGCLSQRYSEELLEELPEVDVFVGTGSWGQICQATEIALSGKRAVLAGALTTLYDHTSPRIHTTEKNSAFVKLAEGCNNCCSYCVIPLVRGPFRSRNPHSVLAEVQNLAKTGVREINLIAQDTTNYGMDLRGKPILDELLTRLIAETTIPWIRLLYCYPQRFTESLIRLLAENQSRVLPYIDIPLQHINDRVLQAMNRQDTCQSITHLLTDLRTALPAASLRTSFIVGFPGETQEEFEQLREFMKVQCFDHVGVFTYSQEEGTAAASLPLQTPEEVKQERYHQLMALQAGISERRNQEQEGHILQVLVEECQEDGTVSGRSYREAPEADGKVYVENAQGCQPGEFIQARVVQGFAYDLLAEKLDNM